jgi:prepilin-type N-terminal cleavage/methylation domain-containing protein
MTFRKARGFTLVEFVIVIVVLGILASIAVPRFFGTSDAVKAAACKEVLGGVRSAIANYYAYTATPTGGGTATWPTLAQLTTAGTVLESVLPDNPYSSAAIKNAVVTGTTKGTPVTSGTSGGWCYLPSTGEFWPDTASGAGEAGF